ncbi:YwbE family protein [Bacillus sp. FSL M7-0996]|uniref:YwbE family protein n=1 Tax=Bacillus sp. FSL M7-0996 TaxID=2921538 RepID=UPI0030F52F00
MKKLLLFLLTGLCVVVLTACKDEEEKLKAAEEQKIDEKKVEEDTKVEEQQKAEEEKRKQEEQQRVEEEKRKQGEQQRVEQEKRKQEEKQKIQQQQERTQKQEKTTEATGGKPTRSQISVGSHVVIQLEKDYSKTVSGVVKDILTNTETHTYGIKVRLQDGQIGRVQSVG